MFYYTEMSADILSRISFSGDRLANWYRAKFGTDEMRTEDVVCALLGEGEYTRAAEILSLSLSGFGCLGVAVSCCSKSLDVLAIMAKAVSENTVFEKYKTP